MSDLRSACIEKMADALYGDLRVGHNPETIYQLGARHALDALLGVLEEHAVPMMRVSVLAQEWVVCEKADADALVVDLAVLREDT